MKLQQSVAIAALFMVSTCSGHIGGGQIASQEIGPQVYCGRNLARAIEFICKFSEYSVDKRTQSGSMYSNMLAPYYKDQEAQPNWPWIPQHRARALSLPSRDKRFVVTECCEKPCSVSELLNYC